MFPGMCDDCWKTHVSDPDKKRKMEEARKEEIRSKGYAIRARLGLEGQKAVEPVYSNEYSELANMERIGNKKLTKREMKRWETNARRRYGALMQEGGPDRAAEMMYLASEIEGRRRGRTAANRVGRSRRVAMREEHGLGPEFWK